MELKNKGKGNPFSTKLKRSIQVESWFDNRGLDRAYAFKERGEGMDIKCIKGGYNTCR